MGIQDLQKLFEINQQIKQFDKKKHYNFIIDTDTKEGKTRIVIDEFGAWKKTPHLTEEQAIEFRKKGFRQFVPDLIDFKNKIIIEYQEESKGRQGVLRRRGKINKKGHDEFSDEDKDIFYELAEFNGDSYVFRFDDGRFINIDLSSSFPNYKLPEFNLSSEFWHFTAIKNNGNQSINLGDIKLFKRDTVRKINTLCTKYSYNNVLYIKSKQTELDRYESTLEPITDNGKLYLYIKDIIDSENKNKNTIKSIRKTFIETLL